MPLTKQQQLEQGERARQLAQLAALRHAAHEAQVAYELLLVEEQRQRIIADLDDEISAKIRALEAQNANLRQVIADDAEIPEQIHDVSVTPGKTAWNTDSHVANTYAAYALKLERYAKANEIKAKRNGDAKPSPEPSRFVLQREMRGGVGYLVKAQTASCFGCDFPTEHTALFYGDTVPMCKSCQESHL